MTKQLFLGLLLSATLVTTACGSSTMTTPDIKFNPHPTKRYELTVTIKDAPGPFDSMQTYVLYDVTDPFCVPTLPGSGATNEPRKSVPLTLTKVGENTYTGTFYSDLIKDEDYSGKGVCHWKLSAVSMYLRHEKLTLPPSITWENILAGKPQTTYFSGLSYADASAERVDAGIEEGGKLRPSDHPFTVTFETKAHVQ
ncbi:hypothetical protein HDE78_000319 [Rhodanobacter sp. K2T2]|jgi:hypothetical protein|uniref:hypothetical protein n=1 Tax=Rhodanobacter sp. K2T2 TaxID=2723085 RepID=UPI0015C77F2F|nr:hypothetical protein [Rhodanobacter sp. K2T2]NYE27394.1 hypothetical protein [Rhodanobacter sp. K2T2]